MKPNLFLIAITLLNAGMLTMSYIQNHRPASTPGADQILRGRGLQIVDDSGHVRASIQVLPQSRQQDGTMVAETVLLRLITEQGRPSVKISTSSCRSRKNCRPRCSSPSRSAAARPASWFICSRVSLTQRPKMRYFSVSPRARPACVSRALMRRGIVEKCRARSNECASQKIP